jgi:NADH-quinone oxidoreductase subunit J
MGAVFLFSSLIALAGALLMVARRNPIYGLLFLLVSFAGAAGVFYSLSATFLAVSQILVYAGAVAVLFLFVLMFVNLRRKGEDQLPTRVGSLAEYDPAALPDALPKEEKELMFSPPAAIVAAVLLVLFVTVILGLPEQWDSYSALPAAVEGQDPNAPAVFGSVKDFGQVMIRDYWLHFEVVGLVVLIGVIGAVVLGRRIAQIEAEQKASTKAAEAAGTSHGGGH